MVRTFFLACCRVVTNFACLFARSSLTSLQSGGFRVDDTTSMDMFFLDLDPISSVYRVFLSYLAWSLGNRLSFSPEVAAMLRVYSASPLPSIGDYVVTILDDCGIPFSSSYDVTVYLNLVTYNQINSQDTLWPCSVLSLIIIGFSSFNFLLSESTTVYGVVYKSTRSRIPLTALDQFLSPFGLTPFSSIFQSLTFEVSRLNWVQISNHLFQTPSDCCCTSVQSEVGGSEACQFFAPLLEVASVCGQSRDHVVSAFSNSREKSAENRLVLCFGLDSAIPLSRINLH